MLFLASAAFAESRIEVTGGTPTFRDVALKFAPLQTQPVQPGAGINVWSSAGLTEQEIRILAVDPSNPQVIYAGTSKGILKSVNKAIFWSNIGLTNRTVLTFAIDPSNPQIIYAGTEQTVFKSLNGGNSWSDIGGQALAQVYGKYVGEYYVLAIDPSNPQVIYAGKSRTIFKSLNGGTSWVKLDFGLGEIFYALAIDPSNPQIVYAGSNRGLTKSTDGGRNWGSIATSSLPEIYTIVVDPSSSKTVYVGTNQGVFKSINGGDSWWATSSEISKDSYSDDDVNTLAIDPMNSQIIYAGTVKSYEGKGGIYISTNGGSTWKDFNKGLPAEEKRQATLDGDIVIRKYPSINILVIDSLSPQTIYSGTDKGVFAFTATPIIGVSSTSLSFGDVSVGSSGAQTFTIKNTGMASLSVTAITSSDPQFTVSPTSFKIAEGDSQNVVVTFKPPAIGARNATLTITHNAAGSPSAVALKGAGVKFPVFKLSASSVTMDNTKVGSTSQKTFTISNPGSDNLSVPGITVSGPDSAQFTVSPTKVTIPVEGNQTVTVTFVPTSEGAKTATLSIAHNATGSPARVSVTGTGIKKPEIAYRPDRLNFGNATTGATVKLPITLYNRGNDLLNVASITSGKKEFAVVETVQNIVISPGDSQTVTISFQPSAPGDITTNLTISSNDLDNKTLSIPVSGTGVSLVLTVDFNPAEGNQKLMTAGGVKPGKKFQAQLFIENAPQIKGFTVRFVFDPKQIAFVPGSFTPGALVPGLLGLANVQKDFVEVGGAALGGGMGAGSGLLGTVAFEGLQGFEKETTLRIPLVVWSRATGGQQAIQTDIQLAVTSAGGIPGDFSADGKVDFDDFFLFASVFGSKDAQFDLDGDGSVGFSDFFTFAEAFGK